MADFSAIRAPEEREKRQKEGSGDSHLEGYEHGAGDLDILAEESVYSPDDRSEDDGECGEVHNYLLKRMPHRVRYSVFSVKWHE